jgi:hypothetical protein
MSSYDRVRTAGRYRQIAAEYANLSKDTADTFLRPYYLRIAKGYTIRADGELHSWEQQRMTVPSGADIRSPQPSNARQ